MSKTKKVTSLALNLTQDINILLKKAKEIKVEWEIITPEYAKGILDAAHAQRIEEGKTNNRTINRDRVIQYVTEMRSGRYNHESSQPIHFNKRGDLLNGQHRLSAIVEYAQPIICLVARNVPETAMSVMDTGRPRTIKDLFLVNGIKYATELTGATRVMWQLTQNRDIPLYEFKNRLRATLDDLFTISETYPDLVNVCREALLNFKEVGYYAGRANAAALLYLFRQKDPTLAAEIFTQLETGAIADPNSPVLECRNLLIKLKNNQRTRFATDKGYRLALIVRTWNLLRDGMRNINLIEDYSLPVPIIK